MKNLNKNENCRHIILKDKDSEKFREMSDTLSHVVVPLNFLGI